MMDVASTRGRLVALIGGDVLATVIAGGAAYAASTLHQNAYWGLFGLVVAAGFVAQFWFIAGFGRAKQGV
ncbi:MAG: hypothetical protein CGW95_17145 [Phenylobacterium zucineum]|nr:MAG: hypothetical protein CGW95_17145 [Phenylobacterium zucineum]